MRNGRISVIDRHFTENVRDPESGELRTSCQIGVDGGSIVIRYHETLEEVNDCETCLMINNGRITMIRSGRYSTSMIFENGKRHICCYDTPLGEIMIGVYTNAMFIDFNENGGVMDFAYTIDSAGDLISENELKITVETEDN